MAVGAARRLGMVELRSLLGAGPVDRQRIGRRIQLGLDVGPDVAPGVVLREHVLAPRRLEAAQEHKGRRGVRAGVAGAVPVEPPLHLPVPVGRRVHLDHLLPAEGIRVEEIADRVDGEVGVAELGEEGGRGVGGVEAAHLRQRELVLEPDPLDRVQVLFELLHVEGAVGKPHVAAAADGAAVAEQAVHGEGAFALLALAGVAEAHGEGAVVVGGGMQAVALPEGGLVARRLRRRAPGLPRVPVGALSPVRDAVGPEIGLAAPGDGQRGILARHRSLAETLRPAAAGSGGRRERKEHPERSAEPRRADQAARYRDFTDKGTSLTSQTIPAQASARRMQ